MRVHELATELNIPSKELLARLHDLGVEAKSVLSALDPVAAELIRESVRKNAEPKKPEVKKDEPLLDDDEALEALVIDKRWIKEAQKEPIRRAAVAAREDVKIIKEKPKAHKPAAVVPPVAAKTPPVVPPAAPKAAPVAPPAAPVAPPVAAKAAPVAPPPPVAEVDLSNKIIHLRGPVVVRELAELLGVRPNQLVAELMRMNILASIAQRVDIVVAKSIAEKHGFTVEHDKKPEAIKQIPKKDKEVELEDKPDDLRTRPPIVTFMGHVDHGKTSLLDRIRNAAVAAGEHGGITQHIGAYTKMVNSRRITFLDTPGHAAFTSMRARGANLTDIAVIVIAADDGIMPQTKEAVMHAKAAGVTIMVAINKIDLPGANPDRIKQQLQQLELAPEEWGGTVICCPVSAVTGEGMDHLLEMILLQADMLDLKVNPSLRAQGYVVEARMEAGRGPTATLLVKSGTLHVGDVILCGPHYGRVRMLINDHGESVKEADPSSPVRCLGLPAVPEAGAEFRVYANERHARDLAAVAAHELKQGQLMAPMKKASLDDLFAKMQESQRLELKVILKADTQGSIEAIMHDLQGVKSEKVSLSVIFTATGNVTENDVMLASASDAVILGFQVGKEPGVEGACRHEGVEVRMFNIIYELSDQMREAMSGLLAPILKEKIMGRAEIRQVFQVGKSNKVAGCRVMTGLVRPRFKVRVKRGAETLYQGGVNSLKHFQESVAEVREGQECGIRLENYTDFATGDVLEFYEIEQIRQEL
jgi:translation initiation factor IF-2